MLVSSICPGASPEAISQMAPAILTALFEDFNLTEVCFALSIPLTASPPIQSEEHKYEINIQTWKEKDFLLAREQISKEDYFIQHHGQAMLLIVNGAYLWDANEDNVSMNALRKDARQLILAQKHHSNQPKRQFVIWGFVSAYLF